MVYLWILINVYQDRKKKKTRTSKFQKVYQINDSKDMKN